MVLAWREAGLMDDTPQEYLDKNAQPITWIELMAKLLSVEAKEE